MKKMLLISLFFVGQVFAAAKPPGAAIASASPYATKAGMAILNKGGNAFDAAITVSAVLAVVEPYHTGIGGGGFWLLHDAKKNKNVFLDGRERAPLDATEHMFLNKFGRPIENLSLFGPLSSAIPGEPAAMAYLAKHYGKLSLAEDLKPAIELAEQGYPVGERYVELVSRPFILKQIQRHTETARIFLDKGEAPKVGWILKQPELANTLKKLGQYGKKGFYEGEVATKLVSSVRKGGGIWQSDDLKDYDVKLREPLVGHYRDVTVVTAPPPSAGGIAILSMLNILSNYPLGTMSTTSRIHTIVEAMRLAYWDRNKYLGDPDFVSIPTTMLLSNPHIKKLRAMISKEKATPSSTLGRVRHVLNEVSPNTTHYSIIDNEGNRVGATLSINFLFGSTFVAKGTGVLLNDEMDDFAKKPGTKNIFGLVGGENNSIAPEKRPLSSMSPTFLITKDRVAVLGTPGGSRIPTMVLLATLSFAEGKRPLSFVTAPRFHHQYLPDIIEYEHDALDESTKKSLIKMGYRLKELTEDYGGKSFIYGEMQACEWNKKENALFATSDPRRAGLALVEYNQ